MIEKTEKEVWKEIESGKYRNFYLVYNRKSTDESENQKNSIKVQRLTNSKYAFDNKLNIALITIEGFCSLGVISEKHSGFKEDDTLTFSKDGLVQYRVERPKFLKLVQLLSRGLFKGIICLCWDRISRNKGDDTIIGKLIKGGIDIRFVWANYDKSSAGDLHMDVDGMFAAHHSRVTSEKVKLVTWSLRDKGVCTYKAPIGYLNTGDMYSKPHDPVKAPLILEMAKLYSTGKWSYPDLAGWAKEHGLTTTAMRPRRTNEQMLSDENDDETDEEREKRIPKISRPMTASNIQEILTNRFYTGRLQNSRGEWIKSVSHEYIIDDELFEEIQMLTKGRRVSLRYSDKITYPYRGMVRCGQCGRAYSPYKKKGIMYYGSRCPLGCLNPKKSCNSTFIEDEVGKIIHNLSLSEDEVNKLEAQTKTDIAVFERKRLSNLELNDRKKKKVREDLAYLRNNKLPLLKSGVYSPEAYLEEESKLSAELLTFQDVEKVSDVAMHEVVKDIVKLSELLKYGLEHYRNANSEEKQEIISIICSELTISGNTFDYKSKNGFKILQNRSRAVGDPTRNRTAL